MILLIIANLGIWALTIWGVISFVNRDWPLIYLLQFIPTVGYVLVAAMLGLVEEIRRRKNGY